MRNIMAPSWTRLWSVLSTLFVVVLAHKVRDYQQEPPMYIIVAPNVFRLGVAETVSVQVHGLESAAVHLYLQDAPFRQRKFSEITVSDVKNGIPSMVSMQVDYDDLPIGDQTESTVILSAECKDPMLTFHQEIQVLVVYEAGYVIIQTDKPIYTPKQQVRVRIIALTEELKPQERAVRLDIMNPQGITVHRHDQLTKTSGFLNTTFNFPAFPKLGNWSAIVRYGRQYQFNDTVKFEVKEYVLPTFDVSISIPKYILPGDTQISGRVNASYVYGKPVDGTLMLKFGIQTSKDAENELLYTLTGKSLQRGAYDFQVSLMEIGNSAKYPNFPSGGYFTIEATVMEKAGGISETENKNALFIESPYKISMRRSVVYFKPGLPYFLKLDVHTAGGSPAPNVPMEVQVNSLAQNAPPLDGDHGLTDENGQIRFRLNIPVNTQGVTLTISTKAPQFPTSQQATRTVNLITHQSPSGHYIVVEPEDRQLAVGQLATMNVYTTEWEHVQNLNYMVLSRGRIIHEAFIPAKETFQLPITRQMAPSSRLILWYIDGRTRAIEVISDSVLLPVRMECPTKIVLPKSQFVPNELHDIKIISDPGTTVGLLGIDKAVYLLNNQDRLTTKKVNARLNGHDLGCGPGSGTASQYVFANAGLAVIGNVNLFGIARTGLDCGKERSHEKRYVSEPVANHKLVGIRKRATLKDKARGGDADPQRISRCCSIGRREDMLKRSCKERSMALERFYGKGNLCVDSFYSCCMYGVYPPPTPAPVIMAAPVQSQSMQTDARGRSGKPGMNVEPLFVQFEVDEEEEENEEEDADVASIVRSFFPETWIFDEVTIGESGQENYPITLPGSITTWSMQAVSVLSPGGICVTPAVPIRAFKKIFISLNMPYAVIRLEQIEIRATVFNYDRQDHTVFATLHGVTGLCTGTVEGEETTPKTLIVRSQESASISFPVVPLELGEYPIRLTLRSSAGTSDVIEKQLSVIAEGVEKVATYSTVLDPSGEMVKQSSDQGHGRRGGRRGKRRTYHADMVSMRQTTTVDLQVPEEAIPRTDKCNVNVRGDLLGAAITSSVDGMESLITMPTGCGEQTLIHMAPTVYALMYLKRTGKLTKKLEETGMQHIQDGYSKELTFRKDDGSFAVWPSHPSTTWLTSFVVKVFCQAEQLAYLDSEVTCQAIKWIVNHQYDNGSFQEPYKVWHREMTGGVVTQDGDVSLTAFVYIALSTCECNSKEADEAREKALRYLESRFSSTRRPFTVAILTYALVLGNSQQKRKAINRLRQLSKYDPESNTRYWPADETLAESSEDIPYWYKVRPLAITIEATAYAMLALLAHGDITDTHPIAIWLVQQRNGKGGFISTQDTVVALQALAEYSTRATLPGLDLNCELRAEKNESFKRSLKIDENNALVHQHYEVPTGGMLFVDTSGKGIGQMQVELRYNVPSKDDVCSFDLFVNTSEHKRQAFSFEDISDDAAPSRSLFQPQRRYRQIVYKVDIHVCVRYLRETPATFFILDVGLFTGFKVNERDMKSLLNDATSNVQRYEVTERAVLLYLDTVPFDKPYCLTIVAEQNTRVGTVQPVPVQIYEYYEPDRTCTAFYHPLVGSPLLETLCIGTQCKCAEGTCPKCYGRDEDQDPLSYAELIQLACKSNFVYTARLNNIKDQNSLERFTMILKDALVTGADEARRGDKRFFLRRKTCICPQLQRHKEYLIIGSMGFKYKNRRKEESYKYFIDNTFYVEELQSKADIRAGRGNRASYRKIRSLIRRLKRRGC